MTVGHNGECDRTVIVPIGLRQQVFEAEEHDARVGGPVLQSKIFNRPAKITVCRFDSKQ